MWCLLVLLSCARGSHAWQSDDRAHAIVDADGNVSSSVVRAEGTQEDDAVLAVAMPASLLAREAAPSSFLAAPVGTTQNLFVPAIHGCNEAVKQEFLKMNPSQAKQTKEQQELEESLRFVHDVLADFDMPTILGFGSALGFYRNCHVIPTDKDGDVLVLGHWLQGKRSIENLAAAFTARNAQLDSDNCEHGPQYTGCELRIWHNYVYGFPTNHIDLFVLATESACDEAPCNFFSSLYRGGVKGPVFNKIRSGNVHFEQADFLNRTFWAPAPIFDYVKLNYGNEWDDLKGGVEKAVDFDKETAPSPDTYGETMPPPEYVRGLERTAPMHEHRVLTASFGANFQRPAPRPRPHESRHESRHNYYE